MKSSNGWSRMILVALLAGGAAGGGTTIANRGNGGSLVALELRLEALQQSVSDLRVDVRLLMAAVSGLQKGP